MPYYHVYISEVEEVYELDMSREKLLRYIVEPYLRNEEFMCSGSRICPSEIEKIKIGETKKPSKELIREVRPKYVSVLGLLGGLSDEEIIMKEGKDVTRQFIIHSPRTTKQKPLKASPRSNKKIFVVHGRDQETVKELKALLLSLGLKPIILHEQPSGSMTIIEKLERYSQDIGFAFVVLTPDDALIPTTESIFIDKKQGTVSPLYFSHIKPILRTRQNVILEFGFFIAKIGRKRVCCLYKEATELPYDAPSDMHGIVYVPFKDSVSEAKEMIIKELEAAGYELSMRKEVNRNNKDLDKLKKDVEMLKRRGINPT